MARCVQTLHFLQIHRDIAITEIGMAVEPPKTFGWSMSSIAYCKKGSWGPQDADISPLLISISLCVYLPKGLEPATLVDHFSHNMTVIHGSVWQFLAMLAVSGEDSLPMRGKTLIVRNYCASIASLQRSFSSCMAYI